MNSGDTGSTRGCRTTETPWDPQDSPQWMHYRMRPACPKVMLSMMALDILWRSGFGSGGIKVRKICHLSLKHRQSFQMWQSRKWLWLPRLFPLHAVSRFQYSTTSFSTHPSFIQHSEPWVLLGSCDERGPVASYTWCFSNDWRSICIKSLWFFFSSFWKKAINMKIEQQFAVG